MFISYRHSKLHGEPRIRVRPWLPCLSVIQTVSVSGFREDGENNLGDAGLKQGIDRNVRLDRENVASGRMEYSFWGWCRILLSSVILLLLWQRAL